MTALMGMSGAGKVRAKLNEYPFMLLIGALHKDNAIRHAVSEVLYWRCYWWIIS